MPLGERVTDYTIAQLKNEVVDYQQVVRLTTETGHQAFIAFPDQPPTQWLTISGSTTTAYLERGEFDRIHHLLQTETPLFFTSGFIVGPVFNLSTSAELPGEGPADDDALAQLMATMRQPRGLRAARFRLSDAGGGQDSPRPCHRKGRTS